MKPNVLSQDQILLQRKNKLLPLKASEALFPSVFSIGQNLLWNTKFSPYTPEWKSLKSCTLERLRFY